MTETGTVTIVMKGSEINLCPVVDEQKLMITLEQVCLKSGPDGQLQPAVKFHMSPILCHNIVNQNM